MYQATLDDVKSVIELNKPLNVAKLKIKEYFKAKQYNNWLEQKEQEYNKEYPEIDENGNIIEYSANPEDKNYKPNFKEWLANKNYEFIFDENNIDFTEVKPLLKKYAKIFFYEEPKNGMFSQTLGVKINCDRHDLDNMKNLLEFMKANNIATIQFRVFDDSFVQIDQNQLAKMISEVIAYGLQLYQRKWKFQQAVDKLETLQDLEELKW